MRERRLARSREAAFRFVEGEAVIILPVADRIFVLNNTGSLVWGMLDSGLTVGEIAENLAEKCNKKEGNVIGDVESFLTLLEKRALINDAGSNGSVKDESCPRHGCPIEYLCNEYEAPALVAEEEIAVVAGLCTSGHSGDPLCVTSGPGCTTLFSP